MPIELIIEARVTLSNTWMDKETWDADYKHNMNALIELLEEDYYQALTDMGGFKAIIKQARWSKVECSQCGAEMILYRTDGSKKYGYVNHYSCPKCYSRANKNLRWCIKCSNWHTIGSKIYRQHRDFLKIITK